MVADTHYYRVLFYTPEGEMLDKKTIGGTNGKGPGEFGFVTDVIQDSKGNYFVSEYGEFDRIQKFSADGEFICQFGRHGDGPIEFNRPQSMVLDENDHIWVADAHNHRIQVLRCPDREPELLAMFGEQGKEPGKFMYPYGIDFDHRGNLLISEYGNHRIQRMTRQGQPLEQFGKPGRLPGELNQPWGCIEDSKHRIHILDSKNHRIPNGSPSLRRCLGEAPSLSEEPLKGERSDDQHKEGPTVERPLSESIRLDDLDGRGLFPFLKLGDRQIDLLRHKQLPPADSFSLAICCISDQSGAGFMPSTD